MATAFHCKRSYVNPTRHRGLLLLVLALAFPCRASAAPLDELKAQFQQASGKVEQERLGASNAAADKYAKSLDAAMEKARGAGDLDAVVALQTEKGRFAKEKSVPAESPADAHRIVAAVQAAYRKFIAQADVDAARKQADLLDRYVKSLEGLKKNLVVEGRIADAQKVKTEMEKAEFMLADARAKLPKSPEGEPPAAAPAGQPPAGTPRGVPPELRRGLVLYYSFDSRDAGGKVPDQSGRGNNGEVRGATWTPKGKVGGAYLFSGGTDHILVACPALRKSSADCFSIAVWFYAERFNPNDENTVFGISAPRGVNDGTFSYRIGIGRPNGQGTDFAIGFTPGSFCRDNSASPFMLGLSEKRWHQAVGVYDAGDIQLYVDGAGQGATRYSLGATPASSALNGCIANSHGLLESRGFSGIIDEMMFFDRALTPAEVRQLCKLGGGQPPIGGGLAR